MRRNRLSREDALKRVAAQIDIEKKRSAADYIIDTTGPHSETEQQVKIVYHQLLG